MGALARLVAEQEFLAVRKDDQPLPAVSDTSDLDNDRTGRFVHIVLTGRDRLRGRLCRDRGRKASLPPNVALNGSREFGVIVEELF